MELTWTTDYKIDGQKLRGFTKTANGDKIYTVYTFVSEDEKVRYQSTTLTGLTFLAHGEFVPPPSAAHHYAFQMDTYLKSKGASGVFEVSSWQIVRENRSIQRWLAEQRFRLNKYMKETFPPSLAPEAQALLIGLQEDVDDDLQRAYQKLGITHLFAISGLHVALVAWIFYEGLLRLHVRKEVATIMLLTMLPVYAVVAGGAPSVWRSVSVVEFVLLARYIKCRLAIDDALALSFIGFVLLEPGVIYQIGFQLSYLATASLIYSSKILQFWTSWWVKSFFITFVCQLLVYPLLLWHFYELSLSSFIVNSVFVPLFSFIILPINIMLLTVSFVSDTMASWLFAMYEPLRLWLTDVIVYLQSLPMQMWTPGRPSIWLIAMAYISVLTTFYCIEQRVRLKWVLTVLFTPIVCIQVSPMLYSELRVTFVNVGQGDCTIIELPYRRGVYVVDTGGLLRFNGQQWKQTRRSYEVGRQVVVPLLKGRGIRKIDVLTLTHADADHVEGAEEVLEEITVGELHVPPRSLQEAVMKDVLEVARHQSVPVKEKIAGFSWKKGDVTLSYLWPKEADDYQGNNDSLVLFVQQGVFRLLLTGDLEEEGELALLQQYGKMIHNVTVLKAGHHGSQTSSSEPFVEAANPTFTIFSAGLQNRYGHPHNSVVERFTRRKLAYFITGVDGTMTVKVKHHTLHVEKETHD